jgi:hypothetical protein
VPRDQPGQVVPAGHQRHAGAATGQQWAHLIGVAGVVEHDQHLPVGHQRPVVGGPLGQVDRDVRAVHAEAAQERGERVGRGHRLLGVEPTQVHIELPVGEAVGDAVRPVDGERGLAGTGGATHDGDDRGLTLAALDHERVQCGQLVVPAGEAEHVGR